MKRKIIFLIIFVFILILGAVVDGLFYNMVIPYIRTDKLITNTDNCVVEVNVSNAGGNLSGTGFIIRKDGVIITNDHVLGDHSLSIQNIRIVLNDKREFNLPNVGILYRNEVQDIAVLKINDDNLPYLQMDASTYLYQKIYVVGYPAQQKSYAEGRVTSSDEIMIDDTSYIQMNAQLDPGFSGAPVVNNYGKVVGIACAKIENNLNFAVPIRFVKAILDRIDPQLEIFNNSMSYKMFHDDGTGWSMVEGNWMRYGDAIVNIANVTEPYPQTAIQGLAINMKSKWNDFILNSGMLCISRFDGFPNMDMGVVFKYLDKDNFLIFSTYSRSASNNDRGGLWQVNNGTWQLLQSSSQLQPFKLKRWYNIKIKSIGGKIQVYLDNVKCIDYFVNNNNLSGFVGYRTVSSHSWFKNIDIYR